MKTKPTKEMLRRVLNACMDGCNFFSTSPLHVCMNKKGQNQGDKSNVSARKAITERTKQRILHTNYLNHFSLYEGYVIYQYFQIKITTKNCRCCDSCIYAQRQPNEYEESNSAFVSSISDKLTSHRHFPFVQLTRSGWNKWKHHSDREATRHPLFEMYGYCMTTLTSGKHIQYP